MSRQLELTNFQNKSDNIIRIYDDIGVYSVSAEAIAYQLDAFNGDDVYIDINSRGGDYIEGAAIHNLISRYDGKTISRVDGVAASAASTIAIASDEVHICENSFFMIHNSSGFAGGTKEDLQSNIDILSMIDEMVLNMLSKKMNSSKKEIKDMMKETTFFNADESVKIGLADSVIDDSGVTNKLDLSMYNNVPKKLTDRKGSRKVVEASLRQLGYSQSEAVQFFSVGKRSMDQRQSDRNYTLADQQKMNSSIESSILLLKNK